MQISRRGVLAGAAAGGGLLVAWMLRPRRFAAPLSAGRDEAVFDAWLKIAGDGVITVAVPQLEMGQGVTTILPQVVAMELGADWRQIAVEPTPVSGAYANLPLAAKWAPLWKPALPFMADDADDWLVRRFAEDRRFMATADGMSLAAYEAPCRHAAAAARAMLAMEAASRWGASWEECEAEGGFIIHGKKRLSFAELALDAARQTPPDPPPLRSLPPLEKPNELGAEAPIFYPRLDLPAKVDGSLLFAGDVRLPDMVYAAISHGPIDRSTLKHFDVEAAAGSPGLVGIVRGKRWIAAVGNTWFAADKALRRLDPTFMVSGAVDSGRIEEALDTGVMKRKGKRIVTRGNGDSDMGKATYRARYDVSPALHAGIETASATARLSNGRLELWIATQAPEHAREAAAKALGLSVADVVLYPMPAGGSFDRRLEVDHAVEVALIARETGRPVQLVWSRGQEALAGRPRTPVAALLSAKTSENGHIAIWRAKLALPPSAQEFGERMFNNLASWSAIEASEGRADPMAVEGAEPPYGFDHVAVEHVPTNIGLPTGRMRGNAHGYTCFFTESFMDELAALHDREPLSYRMEMLGNDPRLAECLQRAARLAEWGGGGDQSGQGLACHRMGPMEAGGRIALIATASQGEGGVKVEKLSAAVDIGRIVNIDIARQQIEGGLIFGMGLALGAATDYERGQPTNIRLAAMALPALADCPQIDVEFVDSDAEPFDPGELGVAVAAPAIANALYSATGLRLRRLPLLSGGL
ncbi:xanthine dehydrogenase [Erythrobacter sp. SG61-1L]|uniref:molybdopterin cofactor-binding domain-containing protein n=1 Tax=Erythrobacter sp. SG61-1L TaxID=1603897 RepID=UPI0006C9124D|nr:molybdopterin cofactor-binding domain-containing protein [Erythrobacter sp. SG61-1L]KPL69416.1 xanthine dehydrogenase [Erythrobacter sp. SG61-1L]